MLLFPDPRPLVERLGRDFFRQAPQCAGVYLMRDAAETVLYVGKAKNLRKRLASYRVANPERMPRRHLRLLRAVARIELQECPDETAALAREAELLRRLRPRFNRAGTWPGLPRFFLWRINGAGLELAVAPAAEADWRGLGPIGVAAFGLRAALVRLLWCAIHPARGLGGMPEGWFDGRHGQVVAIRPPDGASLVGWESQLQELFAGDATAFTEAITDCTAAQTQPFEIAVRQADLETVVEFVTRSHLTPHSSALKDEL